MENYKQICVDRDNTIIVENDDINMAFVKMDDYTVFAGIADNRFVNRLSHQLDLNSKLLIRAVNNRTRERNYFRLYNQLLEKEITDEEFDAEIAANSDDYVVCNNEDADKNDIVAALALCPYLKDVNDVDNMADVFSFSYESIRKSLK